MKRNIIHIDEDKCNGCGLCVPACAEGAIQIIDGKARLAADNLCDGLGACLGHCPQDAIHVEEREADEFDEAAVEKNIAKTVDAKPAHGHGGCPSARLMSFEKPQSAPVAANAPQASAIGNWPVQLKLIPVSAPFLKGADLLLAADCAPFAYADFHRDLLTGKVLLIGCPKLDDVEEYKQKLTAILAQNDVKSLTVAYMEVPCCTGLVALAKQALAASGADIELQTVCIGIRGERR
jgi:NAD-dependent dihydropyrimidine dehydrogenase PreA subunit